MKNFGLFGGTFNPIHRGHLHAADAVKKKFPLDCIYLIPSALPPHKQVHNLASADNRVEMIRLATQGVDYIRVSSVEMSRHGPSYTIDTVRFYQNRIQNDTRLYLIMGLDAFLEIDTWKSYHDLMAIIPFIVLSRVNEQDKNKLPDIDAIDNYLTSTLKKDYLFSPATSCFIHPDHPPIYLVDIHPLNISSTEIRSRIQQGKSIKALVPEPVNHFIKTKGLYL